MDPQTFVTMSEELAKLSRRTADIHATAKAEGRSLSRREKGELSAMQGRLEQLRAQLPPPVDGRMTQHNGADERGDENETEGLRPEQRVADWVRDRGHF